MMGGMPSDTGTRGGNEPTICRNCGIYLPDCICHTDYIEYLEERFEEEQYRLWRERIVPYINKIRPSYIFFNKKNLHSLSGMKGIGLLKKRDKR